MKTGRKIADLREKAGLTQEQFAEKLFVSRELVSKWETGKRRPTHHTMEAMATLLGVSIGELESEQDAVSEELSACIPDNGGWSEEAMTAALNGFLATLTATERSVFVARYYHRKSSFETAWELGLQAGTVRKRLVEIRRKFAEFVKEKEYEYR